jgi:hypothetical protein
MKPLTLTPTSERLFTEFDEAARHHGLLQEWGVGNAVNVAETDYNDTRTALRKHINAMERKVRRLKQELRANAPAQGTVPQEGDQP